MKCSICNIEGHNKSNRKFHSATYSNTDIMNDQPNYTESIDILSVNYWKNTRTFRGITDKETQIK